MADNSYEDFKRRSAVLREHLADPGFLNNQGLGNEVGIHTFCYDASLELEARELVRRCVEDSESGVLPCNVHACNLYDLMMKVLDEEDVYDAAVEMEQEDGPSALYEELQGMFTPREYAARINEERIESNADVLIIYGVGEAYPFIRAHSIMNTIQPLIDGTPVVFFYPGKFFGDSLSLFGRLDDGNYYRAFDLI